MFVRYETFDGNYLSRQANKIPKQTLEMVFMWGFVVIGENLLDIIIGGANFQHRLVKFTIWK